MWNEYLPWNKTPFLIRLNAEAKLIKPALASFRNCGVFFFCLEDFKHFLKRICKEKWCFFFFPSTFYFWFEQALRSGRCVLLLRVAHSFFIISGCNNDTWCWEDLLLQSSEICWNEWFKWFIFSFSGSVSAFVFSVYDSPRATVVPDTNSVGISNNL